MTVRVLRLLEYVYEDNETAERDMQRWHVPATGVISHGGVVIRSAAIMDLTGGETSETRDS